MVILRNVSVLKGIKKKGIQKIVKNVIIIKENVCIFAQKIPWKKIITVFRNNFKLQIILSLSGFVEYLLLFSFYYHKVFQVLN